MYRKIAVVCGIMLSDIRIDMAAVRLVLWGVYCVLFALVKLLVGDTY